MLSSNKEKGNLGEAIAEDYLKESGYIILERNFRTKFGEIDLIAKDRDYIAFIEVKTRCGTLFGSPGEAVTTLKQHKISRTAEAYIMKKNLFKFKFRFDVIEVILNTIEDNKYSIMLIKDAFQI